MKRHSLWWLIVPATVFVICLVAALSGLTVNAELNLHDMLSKLNSPIIKYFMLAFTYLGNTSTVIAVSAFFLVFPKFNKKYGIPAVFTVIVSWLLNTVIKIIIKRGRPDVVWEISADGFSFPSGHAMNNTALYIALLLAIITVCNSKKISKWIYTLLIGVPILIGLSRVYFGVHYLTDVVAGFSLGIVVAFLTRKIYYKYIDKYIRRQDYSAGS